MLVSVINNDINNGNNDHNCTPVEIMPNPLHTDVFIGWHAWLCLYDTIVLPWVPDLTVQMAVQ